MPSSERITEGPFTLRLVRDSIIPCPAPEVDDLEGFHMFADPGANLFGVRDGECDKEHNEWRLPLPELIALVRGAEEPGGYASRRVDLEYVYQEQRKVEPVTVYVQRGKKRLGAIVTGTRVILPLDRVLALLKRVAL